MIRLLKTHIINYRPWWVLAAMATCLALSFLDMTAVPISLPQIQRSLQSTDIMLQWVVNAYLLTLAVFIIMGGRLGDMVGYRRIFFTGAVIFFIASICCATATSTIILIAARALQGMGGAFLIPSTSVIILNTFEPQNRGKAIGIYVGTASVFLAFGPFVGGILTGLASWRWVFWLNIPLLVASIVLTLLSVAKDPIKPVKKHMDWWGLILLIIALTSLTLAIMEGYSLGIRSYLLMILLFFAVVGALLFIIVERRVNDPLVDFSIFKNKIYVAGVIAIFCLQFVLITGVFRAIWLQNVLGYTPTIAGLLTLPGTVPILIMSPLGGRLLDKYGVGLPTITGLLLSIFGMLFVAVTTFFQNYWIMLPGVVCLGLGVPLAITPLITTALSSVEIQKRGIASGVFNATRQAGGTLGLALLGAIVTVVSSYYLAAHRSSQMAYTNAIAITSFVATFFIFIALVAVYRIRNTKLTA